jgi:hypothetical protein
MVAWSAFAFEQQLDLSSLPHVADVSDVSDVSGVDDAAKVAVLIDLGG